MRADFEAYVTAALFERNGEAAFALGDGQVAFESGAKIQAHDGAVLAAALHPSGAGILSGGDDGRVVLSTPQGAAEIAKIPGRWIETIAASADSGLIAFGAGKDLHVRDIKDAAFARTFAHERTVADIAFEPKGRRLASATYGGVLLWYARIADQKPVRLNWAGAHTGLAYSPDGRFLISSMQENQLHGWRLSDAKDLRMGGYPAKVKSLAFLAKGGFMATSGANGVVLWPFVGANGPMGKAATEIGYDQTAMVTRVAGALDKDIVAAGLDDGRVWVCDVRAEKKEMIKAEKGPPITALALTADGRRIAYGDEAGGAAVVEVPAL